VLARFYAARWAVLPNLGTDLLAWVLMTVLPVHVAGRLVLAAVLLLPVVGAVVYHRSLFGQRSLWPLGSASVASGGAFLLGFLNFSASLGAGLCMAALWTHWRERRTAMRSTLLVLGGAGVLMCHLGGFLLLSALVATASGARAWSARKSHPWSGPIRPFVLDALVLGCPLLLLLASPRTVGDGGPILWRMAGEKVSVLLAPVRGYEPALDLALASLVFTTLAVCLVRRWGRMPIEVGVVLALVTVAACVAPMRLDGAGFVDLRFACMAWLLIFAGFQPVMEPLSPQTGPDVSPSSLLRVALPCLLSALLVVRTASLASTWQSHEADLGDLRTAMAPVQPGERVLVAEVTPEEAPDYWALPHPGRAVVGLQRTDVHVSGLLVPERRAFWPMLFDYPSQQPVSILPPYDRLADAEQGPVDYRILAGAPDRLVPALQHWREDYDWVLLMDAGGAPSLRRTPPSGLYPPVTWTDSAALFRVVRPVDGPGG
jgi:hypothetical protein